MGLAFFNIIVLYNHYCVKLRVNVDVNCTSGSATVQNSFTDKNTMGLGFCSKKKTQ